MADVKRLLEHIYDERDFFAGNAIRLADAVEEDAKDFADYEAAVDALEVLIQHVRVEPDTVAEAVLEGAEHLVARLRRGEPADVRGM